MIEIVHLEEVPEAVDPLAEVFWREWGIADGLTLDQVTARVEACRRGDALPLALVARDGHTLAGSVALLCDAIVTGSAPGPWLGSLWVHPEFRRHGVGAMLIAAAERRAGSLGLTDLYAATSTAVRLFERAGWTRFEEFQHGRELLTVFHMNPKR